MTGIETLRKELEGFEHGVELTIQFDGSIDIRIQASVDAPADLVCVQELNKRLGISFRKLERDNSIILGNTALRGENVEEKIEIRGPWSNCKIVGYKKEIRPAKPEEIIPAQAEKEINVPIYDCVRREPAIKEKKCN